MPRSGKDTVPSVPVMASGGRRRRAELQYWQVSRKLYEEKGHAEAAFEPHAQDAESSEPMLAYVCQRAGIGPKTQKFQAKVGFLKGSLANFFVAHPHTHTQKPCKQIKRSRHRVHTLPWPAQISRRAPAFPSTMTQGLSRQRGHALIWAATQSKCCSRMAAVCANKEASKPAGVISQTIGSASWPAMSKALQEYQADNKLLMVCGS